MNAPNDSTAGGFEPPSRRRFLQSATAGAGAAPLAGAGQSPGLPEASRPPAPLSLEAKWIWYPELRTLPCTFVFFRREFELPSIPREAVAAWVSGNSRYHLYVNGQYVQRGPAPCDPRYWDADPVELGRHLKRGTNTIAALVCSFGTGESTYIAYGRGGFLFEADLRLPDGRKLITDESWLTLRARCWPPGAYRRERLYRALQEQFDARLYPAGWQNAGFDAGRWRPASVQPARRVFARAIPLLREERVTPARLSGTEKLKWKIPPEEYFENYTPDAFEERREPAAPERNAGSGLFPVDVEAGPDESAVVTFEFEEEVCGHPFVKLRAPEGAVVEILFAESRQPDELLLRSFAGDWVRLITGAGETDFEAFDYEALRVLQFVVRGGAGPVRILEAGVTRRVYPYRFKPDVRTPDSALNRVVSAATNTHVILCTDVMVDNVARERQQYAGEIGHSKLCCYYGFGEYVQPARMIRSLAPGQSTEGWFLDCWPAFGRIDDLWRRHLGLTRWGPLVDHALAYVNSIAHHYLFSGDRRLVEELYPRVVRFDDWLQRQVGPDGMLPVSGYTWAYVWIDHNGWESQADKQAALNLDYAGYLEQGLARIADWMAEPRRAAAARERAREVLRRVREAYWSSQHGVFVDNLPRVAQDGELRLHDRTCAVALLTGAIPEGEQARTLEILASLPTSRSPSTFELREPRAKLGFSHPPNAGWRLAALSRHGYGGAVVKDLRERWGSRKALLENNTLAECWDADLEKRGIWTRCQNSAVPLFILYGEVLGIRPTAPAFATFDVRPQLGDLTEIEGTVHAPRGDIRLRCRRAGDRLVVSIAVPPGSSPALVFPDGSRLAGLPAGVSEAPGPVASTRRWVLPPPATREEWAITVSGIAL